MARLSNSASQPYGSGSAIRSSAVEGQTAGFSITSTDIHEPVSTLDVVVAVVVVVSAGRRKPEKSVRDMRSSVAAEEEDGEEGVSATVAAGDGGLGLDEAILFR